MLIYLKLNNHNVKEFSFLKGPGWVKSPRYYSYRVIWRHTNRMNSVSLAIAPTRAATIIFIVDKLVDYFLDSLISCQNVRKL